MNPHEPKWFSVVGIHRGKPVFYEIKATSKKQAIKVIEETSMVEHTHLRAKLLHQM